MPFHAACNGKFPARAGPQGQDMRQSRSAHRRLAGSSFRPSYSPMNWTRTPSRSFKFPATEWHRASDVRPYVMKEATGT